jgi:hypothetical protein
VNRQKGAKGPLEWMPPRESFHCQYVTRFKRVLIIYGLELGATERERFEALRPERPLWAYLSEGLVSVVRETQLVFPIPLCPIKECGKKLRQDGR